MSQRPYKTLFRRKGISMRNSRMRRNLTRTGRRKVLWDSRRRGLNPQDSRAIKKVLR
jgi:hypothetical protein